MPAILDDPTSPVKYRVTGRGEPQKPGDPLPDTIVPKELCLKDKTTQVTLLPISHKDQVPERLAKYLCSVLNAEIEGGQTYPMMDEFEFEDFRNYWFSNFAAIMLEGTYQNTEALMDLDAQGTDWSVTCFGSYYIKPNFPGRSSHICNAGFIVGTRVRSKGVGRLMGETYLDWAPKLGYMSSMFNLVYESNTASLRIWDHLQFKRAGRIKACGKLKGKDELVDAIIFTRDFEPNGEDFIAEERFDKIRYYLKNNKYPPGADRAEKSRLRSAATHYRLGSPEREGEEEKLFLKDKEVVAEPARQHEIAKSTHYNGHGGINKTTATIADRYHWVRIKETVSVVIKQCPECNPTNGKAPNGQTVAQRARANSSMQRPDISEFPQLAQANGSLVAADYGIPNGLPNINGHPVDERTAILAQHPRSEAGSAPHSRTTSRRPTMQSEAGRMGPPAPPVYIPPPISAPPAIGFDQPPPMPHPIALNHLQQQQIPSPYGDISMMNDPRDMQPDHSMYQERSHAHPNLSNGVNGVGLAIPRTSAIRQQNAMSLDLTDLSSLGHPADYSGMSLDNVDDMGLHNLISMHRAQQEQLTPSLSHHNSETDLSQPQMPMGLPQLQTNVFTSPVNQLHQAAMPTPSPHPTHISLPLHHQMSAGHLSATTPSSPFTSTPQRPPLTSNASTMSLPQQSMSSISSLGMTPQQHHHHQLAQAQARAQVQAQQQYRQDLANAQAAMNQQAQYDAAVKQEQQQQQMQQPAQQIASVPLQHPQPGHILTNLPSGGLPPALQLQSPTEEIPASQIKAALAAHMASQQTLSPQQMQNHMSMDHEPGEMDLAQQIRGVNFQSFDGNL